MPASSEGIRKRAKGGAAKEGGGGKAPQAQDLTYFLKRPSPSYLRLFKVYIFCISWLAAVLFVSWSLASSLPQPKNASSTPLYEFSEERALPHLKRLSDEIGVRLVGSKGYFQAIDYLLAALRAMQADGEQEGSGARNRMEIDVQQAAGAVTMRKLLLSNVTTVYEELTNVVVRVWNGTEAGRENAILVNSHFDSAVDSPGASDAAAPCSVMLELVRALLYGEPLKHAAIFLFNGGEEYFLLASHGFITKHPWVPTIRHFVNLESVGTGGRELLFQVGPGDVRLAQVYAETVPRPASTAIAQDIFQSNVIPSDTDFRIFRDFGNLSGYDFAYPLDGYYYHTALDTSEKIDSGTLQNTGDNILSLIHGLARAPWFGTPPSTYHRSQAVYFDFLGNTVGRVVMAFPTSDLLLYCLYGVSLSFAAVLTFLMRDEHYRKDRPSLLRDAAPAIFDAWLNIVGPLVMSIMATGLCVMLTISTLRNVHTWYCRLWRAPLVYGGLSCVMHLFAHQRFHQSAIRRLKPGQSLLPRTLQVELSIGAIIAWAGLAVFLAWLRVGAAYVPLVYCVSGAFALYTFHHLVRSFRSDALRQATEKVGIRALSQAVKSAGKDSEEARAAYERTIEAAAEKLEVLPVTSDVWWMAEFATASTLPTALFTVPTVGVLRLFVPLMGRAGQHKVTEFAIAILCVFLATFHAWTIVPFLHRSRDEHGHAASRKSFKLVLGGAFIIFLVSMACGSCLTGMSPYSETIPKRLIVQHSLDFRGLSADSPPSSSMLAVPLDPAFDRFLEGALAGAVGKVASEAGEHDAPLLSGTPHKVSLVDKMTVWYPLHVHFHQGFSFHAHAPEGAAQLRPTIKLVEDGYDAKTGVRSMTVEMHAPGTPYSTLEIGAGERFLGWDLPCEAIRLGTHDNMHPREHIVRHVAGRADRWRLSLRVRGQARVQFVLSSSYLGQPTPAHARLLAELPAWITPVGWTSVVDSADL